MNFKSLRLACVLCFLCATAHAQNCVTQALGSLSKARSEIVAGNQEKGRQWIEQAALECPTSAVVLRKIADLYEAIGDLETARSWRERAVAQERGTPLKLHSPAPSASISAAAAGTGGCDPLLK